MKTLTAEFELGKEFEQEIVDGRKVKTVFKAEGAFLLETQYLDAFESHAEWKFDEKNLVVTYVAGGVVGVQSSQRQ